VGGGGASGRGWGRRTGYYRERRTAVKAGIGIAADPGTGYLQSFFLTSILVILGGANLVWGIGKKTFQPTFFC